MNAELTIRSIITCVRNLCTQQFIIHFLQMLHLMVLPKSSLEPTPDTIIMISAIATATDAGAYVKLFVYANHVCVLWHCGAQRSHRAVICALKDYC